MRLAPDWKETILARRYAIEYFNWSGEISNKYSQPLKSLLLSGHGDSLDFLAGQLRDGHVPLGYDRHKL